MLSYEQEVSFIPGVGRGKYSFVGMDEYPHTDIPVYWKSNMRSNCYPYVGTVTIE